MITQCANLFQLLPTSPLHRWLIAADWLEEAGAEVAAAAFREGIFEAEEDQLSGISRNFGISWCFGEAANAYCGRGDGNGCGNCMGETIERPHIISMSNSRLPIDFSSASLAYPGGQD